MLERLALALLLLVFATPADASAREWRFRVFLGDREIGYHHFALAERDGAVLELSSEARFNVRVLFFDAYRYTHDATERWSDGCLTGVSANTDDNGTRLQVAGASAGGAFSVYHADGEAQLPSCVMTFAYWNPAMLEQQRLLNVQTGAYVDVGVEPQGEEIIRVRNVETAARRYALQGEDFQVDLWYSPEGEWLALESELTNGKRLRYELI